MCWDRLFVLLETRFRCGESGYSGSSKLRDLRGERMVEGQDLTPLIRQPLHQRGKYLLIFSFRLLQQQGTVRDRLSMV